MQADLFTAVILPVSLSIIMLGMGLSLHRDDFSRVLTQPKAVIIGVIAQMLLLPIIAFSIALVFELPPLASGWANDYFLCTGRGYLESFY